MKVKLKNEARRANLNVDKRILKSPPFWNKMYFVHLLLFRYRASTLWNNQKDSIAIASDINLFKKLAKEQLKFLTFLPNYGKRSKSDNFIYF